MAEIQHFHTAPAATRGRRAASSKTATGSGRAPVRHSFGRLPEIETPDLLAIQTASFAWLLRDGLREAFAAISPIEDFSGTLALEFGELALEQAPATPFECRERGLTYQAPLRVTARLVNKETGELVEQAVFLGDFPLMTDSGTFIVSGTERVVVSQLVRSPGAYLLEPKEPARQVFIANLMPSRGSWLELEIDKKGVVYARIDRKRKLPLTTLLRALPSKDPSTGFQLDAQDDAAILVLFDGSPLIERTLAKDSTQSREQALVELFKHQRPGEPATLDNAENLLRSLFFDPRRYDLTRAGRYKLNQRLGLQLPAELRLLTTEDILTLAQRLVSLPTLLGADIDAADLAREAASRERGPIKHELDEYEHFGNRRLRTTGELLQEALRVGLYRFERLARERMTSEDPKTMTPRTLVNIRPLQAALKEFLGSSQLSQFMDQTNTLSGLTHRRRLSALGPGGLTRERAPLEVRDVHPTHYGRMCPIETPEGPNIGLIGTLASLASVSELGFLLTPYRKVVRGRVSEQVVLLDAFEEGRFTIAQASEPLDGKGRFLNEQVLCRSQADEAVLVSPQEVDYMDVSPAQIVSVATALIPFLEHNDANRALMGANMQRQAVPLLTPQSPLVGTGLEGRAALDSADVVLAAQDGVVDYVDGEQIVVKGSTGSEQHRLVKFQRSNQGTLVNQRPSVQVGERVEAGQLLADCSSSDQGELALGANLLVAFMPFEGYNFEDSIVLSERLVKDDVLTSIHIHEYELEARQTKIGDEEVTRDIPNLSEAALAQLDEHGVISVGSEVKPGDILVGKVTPKGESELSAEEKLIRAIFKEKAREVRDSSLKVPNGQGGVVTAVKAFTREQGDELKPGVIELVRVSVAQKRRISEGDKLAGRHGNKGVVSRIVPEEDMPFLPDGRSVDIILNPLGVPSRMNIGQILETHLGLAAANGAFPGASRPNPRAKLQAPRPTSVATPVFDGATPLEIEQALQAVSPDPGSGLQASGKTRLFDGKSGRPFTNEVTVGFIYILKLLHLVDDKIHARSTGPYSLVTQQPLGGKAQFGGQRFGEMEVWALEAHGAAYTLQEMLTIKSDDTVGRVKAFEAMVKGESLAEPSLPESFKVLIKEMQALGLDVRALTSQGSAELSADDEDDDLLRAAEALGLDPLLMTKAGGDLLAGPLGSAALNADPAFAEFLNEERGKESKENAEAHEQEGVKA